MVRRRIPFQRSGDRFGAYIIGRYLGSGGFADVYEATLEGDPTPLVLKVQEVHDRLDAGRFEREVEALRLMDHPAVPRLLDTGREGGWCFLVTEFHPARPLQEVAERRVATGPGGGKFTVPEVVRVLRSIGAALDQAHHLGVFHRDLKPQNVLVREGFDPLLIDFGLSRIRRRTRVTRQGSFVGTFAYSTPEMIDDTLPLDGRSDQFQLAALAHWMFTGTLPYPIGAGSLDLLARFGTPPAPLVSRIPDLPGTMAAALERALFPDPAGRFPSMKEFLRKLPLAVITTGSGCSLKAPEQPPSGRHHATSTLVERVVDVVGRGLSFLSRFRGSFLDLPAVIPVERPFP